MTEEMKTERITTMMSPSEVRTIDDWAFANRIRSRGEAIRRLIEAGLKTAKAGASPSAGDPGSSSKPGGKSASRPRKPAPARKAEPAQPRSKLEQIRALREHGAR